MDQGFKTKKIKAAITANRTRGRSMATIEVTTTPLSLIELESKAHEKEYIPPRGNSGLKAGTQSA